MRHVISRIIAILAIIFAAAVIMGAQEREPVYKGRPLSAWIQSIREHDSQMELAFEAIQALGPRASAAVPELIKIFDDPFSSIRVGIDDDDVIAQKLSDIQVRSDVVDSLGAIGTASAPAAASLIQWALTPRVVAADIHSIRDYNAFVDLVTLDVVERMRVVIVITKFRLEAADPIFALLHSQVTDERKLGVAILQGFTLPFAAELMKAGNCESRKVGIALMVDLWSVVATEHLVDLKELTACETATK